MTVHALFKCLKGTVYYRKNLGMFYSDVRIVEKNKSSLWNSFKIY